MKIKKFLKKINWPKLLAVTLLTFAAAFVGSLFTATSVSDWYQTLSKPAFNPPNWVFGPVWTVLYILMAIAAYLVWEKESLLKRKKVSSAMFLFFSQLIINALWSIVFFGLQEIKGAFFLIIVLLALIIATMMEFKKVEKWSCYLMRPYLLWVLFATILNLSLLILNK